MDNLWNKLKREGDIIAAVAPMADVTDAVFRRMLAKYGKPTVMWTEFVSADGLMLGGKERLMRDLWYTEEERPIIAQLFGANLETMEEAARLAESLGFDGIDLNMGCPDRSIEKQGSGAAHIKNAQHAAEVIKAAQRGAPSLPISVKTRVGYHQPTLSDWIPHLLDSGIAALTIHARTRKEMSKVPARWEHVGEVVAMRDRMGIDIPVLGNGDVSSYSDGVKRAKEVGADGFMVGRGLFGNPWFFSPEWRDKEIPLEEKLRVLMEHTELFEEVLGAEKNFMLLKKHYRLYVTGFDGAAEFRASLMEATSAAEVRERVQAWYHSRYGVFIP